MEKELLWIRSLWQTVRNATLCILCVILISNWSNQQTHTEQPKIIYNIQNSYMFRAPPSRNTKHKVLQVPTQQPSNSFILLSVSQKIHSLFQSKFSTVRSTASSSNFQSSRHFCSITCCGWQFLCSVWPIKLAFLLLIISRIFLSSITLCNTSSLLMLVFFILLQHHKSLVLLVLHQ